MLVLGYWFLLKRTKAQLTRIDIHGIIISNLVMRKIHHSTILKLNIATVCSEKHIREIKGYCHVHVL